VSFYGLDMYIKKDLKAEENYENSNISPCKNITLRKSSTRNQNLSKTLQLYN
jgi:hypothetical protein